MAEPRDFARSAHDEISLTARFANKTMPPVPANAYPLADAPCGHTRSNSIDATGDFVLWDAWRLQTGPRAIFNKHIAMADATCLDLNSYLSRPGFWNIAFHQFPVPTGLANLCRFHSFHSICLPLQKRQTLLVRM